MDAMAIQHKISDTVKMHVDWEGRYPVVEIEFRFIRYRLMIDESKWALTLAELLTKAGQPELKKKGEELKLPRLYKDWKKPNDQKRVEE